MALERLPSDERKRQIAEAALRILASRGTHRLTAMEIGQAIGVSDAAVFRHFRTKDAIVAAAIDRFEELLRGDIVHEGADPVARLGAFFVRRIHKAREHPEILRLAFDDRLAEIAGPEGLARVRQVIGGSIAFVRGCIEEAQKKRLVAADVPPDVLVWTVVGCLRGAASATPAQGAPSPEAVWADLEKVLRRTWSPKRPARRRS